MPDAVEFLRLTPKRALGFAAVAVAVLGVVSLCLAPAVSVRAAADESSAPVRLLTPHVQRPLQHIAVQRARPPHEAWPYPGLSALVLPSWPAHGTGRRESGPPAADARTRPWDFAESGVELSPRARRQYPMRKNSGYFGRDSVFPEWLHRPLSTTTVSTGGETLPPVLTGTAWHHSAAATAAAGDATSPGSLAQRCSVHGVWAAPLGRCRRPPARMHSRSSPRPPSPCVSRQKSLAAGFLRNHPSAGFPRNLKQRMW